MWSSKPAGKLGSLYLPKEEGQCSVYSGNSPEATSVIVLEGLRGLIGLQCVFVYCMSWKTWTPKALGFRRDNGDLAPFYWGVLWAARLSKCNRRLFLQLLCGGIQQKNRSFLVFINVAFPFPSSPFPDVPTLKTHRSQNQHQPLSVSGNQGLPFSFLLELDADTHWMHRRKAWAFKYQ